RCPLGKIYVDASSKFNLVQAARGRKIALGAKLDSRKIAKRDSPNDLKSRAQWNLELEKALVEILLQHNTTYHRGRNGWNGEIWNLMVGIFHARHSYVKFSKSQVQEKEKELKRDYKMLKEARKQKWS
uniref:Myb/SANT-like domain-containing protein n=1 Tax=Triticum urartu TaxID=4572 RepID=A0A8R7QYD8_TRIUA